MERGRMRYLLLLVSLSGFSIDAFHASELTKKAMKGRYEHVWKEHQKAIFGIISFEANYARNKATWSAPINNNESFDIDAYKYFCSKLEALEFECKSSLDGLEIGW